MKIIFIGKPGVGKTTLFSRLTKRQTYSRPKDEESITSDYQTGVFERDGVTFFPVDTVGLVDGRAVREGSSSLKDADLVFVICDPLDFNATDDEIINEARKFSRKLWIVANKSESEEAEEAAEELYRYGLPVYCISALHKKGVDDLLDEAEAQEVPAVDKPDKESVSCLVVGAPNAGKSTFLNAILGESRFKTSPIPGTTNEIVAETYSSEFGLIKFYDSAGIFRRYRREELRVYNMSLFKDALRETDTVCFIIDASKQLTQKELRIAALIKHKPCLLLFNKSDITPLSKRRMFMNHASETFSFLPAPGVFMVSAAKKKGIKKAVREIVLLKERAAINFQGLDRRIKKIVEESRLHLFILSAKQVSFSPPAILIKYRSKRKPLTSADERYLERMIRENYELSGVPVKIKWQKLG
ncbi:GTP-binding protein [bacterium]|nr:GTP-binding protein [bacterium]MBU3930139.1 GTP-binding protein [bacterium]MBU4123029.1 GTP-binding protein [bacterium]